MCLSNTSLLFETSYFVFRTARSPILAPTPQVHHSYVRVRVSARVCCVCFAPGNSGHARRSGAVLLLSAFIQSQRGKKTLTWPNWQRDTHGLELSEKSNFHKGDENVSMAVTAHHNMSRSSVMRAARVNNSSQSGGRPIFCPQDISVQGGGPTVGSAQRLASIHPLLGAASAPLLCVSYGYQWILPYQAKQHQCLHSRVCLFLYILWLYDGI